MSGWFLSIFAAPTGPTPEELQLFTSAITTLPPTITQAEYGVYGIQAFAVVATFCTGIMLVPSLTSSIFSGNGGQMVFPGLSRFMRR